MIEHDSARRHRVAWLICHPLITWSSVPLLAAESRFPDPLRIVAAAALIFFPLALYFRWRGSSLYRARTYLYSCTLAFTGSLAWATLMLAFLASLGGGRI